MKAVAHTHKSMPLTGNISQALASVDQHSKHHNHHNCVDQAVAQARLMCEQQGQRFTPLRQRVLELVWQSHKPVGAYAVLNQLAQQEKRKPTPPTVYRSLEFLLSLGVIHRIASLNAFIGCAAPGHGVASSQFFICSSCSEVRELQNNKITELIIASAKQQGFSVQQHSMEVVGVCFDCQQT